MSESTNEYLLDYPEAIAECVRGKIVKIESDKLGFLRFNNGVVEYCYFNGVCPTEDGWVSSQDAFASYKFRVWEPEKSQREKLAERADKWLEKRGLYSNAKRLELATSLRDFLVSVRNEALDEAIAALDKEYPSLKKFNSDVIDSLKVQS